MKLTWYLNDRICLKYR